MKRALVFALVLTLSATGAWADRYDDCKQSGDPDRKIRGCTQIIERGEQETQKKRANAYSNRGFAYDDKGEYDKAIADYTQAIKINPKNAIAYTNRGAVYYSKGALDRAIADFDEAIKLNPNDALAYANRGIAYDNKGEVDRAIADFDKAIALDPNDGEAYKNRGAAYRRTGTVKVGALAPKRMRNVFVVPPSVMLNVTGALAPARMRNVSALGQKVLPPLTFPASHRSQRSSRGHRMHRRRASFPMVMEGSKPIRFIIPIARLAESAAMLE